MRIYSKYFCLLLLSFSLAGVGFAQVTITGPTCVVAGTVYQYTITGSWDSTSTMQVCVNAGTIADSSGTNTCTPTDAPLASVLVVWNDSTSNQGVISVNSSVGNATITVNFAEPLQPGSIDSVSKSQIVSTDSIPSIINCSADSGGSCSPSYNYQWQQSSDMVSWTDIAGANNENLSFDSTLVQSTFFRRKVTETTSGTVGYSEVATVTVVVSVAVHFNDDGAGQITVLGPNSRQAAWLNQFIKPF